MREGRVNRKRIEQENEWDRSERRSTRIALAIALTPIPVAIAISWSLGSPPWREKPAPDLEETAGAITPADPVSAHGHR